jgi:hypothetical protein
VVLDVWYSGHLKWKSLVYTEAWRDLDILVILSAHFLAAYNMVNYMRNISFTIDSMKSLSCIFGCLIARVGIDSYLCVSTSYVTCSLTIDCNANPQVAQPCT